MVKYLDGLDEVATALAHTGRRQIIDRLHAGPATTSELATLLDRFAGRHQAGLAILLTDASLSELGRSGTCRRARHRPVTIGRLRRVAHRSALVLVAPTRRARRRGGAVVTPPLVIERVVAAPLARARALWTTAAGLAEWWWTFLSGSSYEIDAVSVARIASRIVLPDSGCAGRLALWSPSGASPRRGSGSTATPRVRSSSWRCASSPTAAHALDDRPRRSVDDSAAGRRVRPGMGRHARPTRRAAQCSLDARVDKRHERMYDTNSCT